MTFGAENGTVKAESTPVVKYHTVILMIVLPSFVLCIFICVPVIPRL
jgi:hypothetical protein